MVHPAKTKRVLALGCLFALIAGQARADSFTPAQRQEIVSIVREALKSDPSILRDAIVSLRAEEEQAQANDSAAAVQRNKAALAADPDDYIAGNPNGDVTLVEFYDPRCPYCRRTLPEIDALLAQDHRLRIVEKLIPILGPSSVLQARAIAAAGRQNKYAVLQHALMETTGQPDLAQIRDMAGRAGLDLTRFDRDMVDPTLAGRQQAAVVLASSLGINGTPSFVIGDKVIIGAVEPAELRRAIAAVRAG